RAHPWLQHGFPEGLSGSDRGVRSAVPDGRRRRGLVLAATRVWLEPRLQSGRDGLAPPPELRAHLLEAADRLRPRGGDAGAEVAREVQRAGARALGGPHVRARPRARPRVAPAPHLSRRLGKCAVPVALPAGAQLARLLAPDARTASAPR